MPEVAPQDQTPVVTNAIALDVVPAVTQHTLPEVAIVAERYDADTIPVTTSKPVFNGKTALIIVWLFGVSLAGWSLLMSVFVARKLVRHDTQTCVDRQWLQTCESIARKLRIRNTPPLLLCEATNVPMVTGIFRPVILIPDDETLDPQSVLMHELSHVKRRDTLWQLASRIVCAVYWFHPFTWWIARKIRVEREHACDDMVLLHGREPGLYAKLLLEIATKVSERDPCSGLTVNMARKHQVEERIDAILDTTKKRAPLGRRTAWTMLLLLLTTVFLGAMFSPFAPIRLTKTVADSVVQTENRHDPDVEGLKIRILDESGTPQPGIVCEMSCSFGYVQTPPEMKKTTDADGEVLYSVRLEEVYNFSIHAYSADMSRQASFPFTGDKPFVATENGGLGLGNVLTLTLRNAKTITGKVVDADGKGIAGVDVGVKSFAPSGDERSDGTTAYFPMIHNAATTDRDGTYTILIPQEAVPVTVYAKKNGMGLDFISFPNQAQNQFFGNATDLDRQKVPTLKLNRVHPLTIRLVDEQGNGIPGIRVWPNGFHNPDFQDGSGTLVSLQSTNDFMETTDASGTARFDWFNYWGTNPVTFSLFSRDDFSRPAYSHDPIAFLPREPKDEITVVMKPYAVIGGTVAQADGTPVTDATVKAFGGEYVSQFRTAKTDEAGCYEIAVPDGVPVALKVEDRHWTSLPKCDLIATRTSPLENTDFTARKTTRLHGRILSKGTPVQTQVYLPQFSDPNLASPEFYPQGGFLSNEDYENPMKGEGKIACYIIDSAKNGMYELFLGPGHYRFCSGYSRGKVFTITDETDLPMDFELSSGETATQEELTDFFDRTLGGSVTLDGRPVPNATVNVVSLAEDRVYQTRADASGCYEIRLGEEGPRLVFARDSEGKHAALVRSPKENNVARVALQPTKTVHGRLLEKATGRSIAHCKFQCGPRFPGLRSHQGSFKIDITTDGEGRFTIPNLAVECQYNMSKGAVFAEDPDAWGSVHTLGEIKINETETSDDIDLGDFKVESFEADETMRVLWYKFSSIEAGLIRRYEAVQALAKDNERRIFILFTDGTIDDAFRQFIRLMFHDIQGKKAFERYQLLCVNLENDHIKSELPELAKRTGIAPERMQAGTICILGPDGKPLITKSLKSYFDEDEINKPLFLILLGANAR